MNSICHALAGATLILGIMPAAALAQTAPPAPAGDSLEEVVVTAQKRSEDLQKVPLAITAVTGAQLENIGVVDSVQLNQVSAGLNIRTQLGSFLPAIRGIGTSSNVVENPVALYIDGVYIPQQREGIRDLNDIDQLAVLKGPQGTLFGRNATGGVIQITTKAPSQQFEGAVSSSFDNFETYKGDVYVNGAVTDKISANLSANYSEQGLGWGTDLTDGSPTYKLFHQYGFMSKVLIEASDDTRITIGADYMNRAQIGTTFVAYPGTKNAYPGAGPLPSPWDTYAGTNSLLGFNGGGTSVTINQDLHFANLLSITSYRQGVGSWQFDNSAVPAPLYIIHTTDAPNKDYTEEVQLVSPKTDVLSWVAGVFYFHNLNGVDPLYRTTTGVFAPAPTSNALTVTTGNETTQSVAPFAQLGWTFLEDNELTLGVRYTEETRDFTGSVLSMENNGKTGFTSTESSIDLYRTTYRVALDHNFSKDTIAYVSVNTGVKSGGFNILNPANPGYRPENLTDYETGFKTELLDNRLRLNSSAFYYDYKNIQVIDFTSGIQTIVNGAAAKLYGIDIDTEAELAHGLKFTGGLELLHAVFTSYDNAVIGIAKPTGGALLTVGSATGNRLPLAQNYAVITALDYDRNVPYGTFHFNVTSNFNGNYYFEADNNLRQPAYINLNSSVKLTLPSERYSFTLWAENLLNNAVITQATTQANEYPTSYGEAPRTYGITAHVYF